MKKIFYLMISVAVAIVAASCEKDNGGNDSVPPIVGTVPASAVAGSDVTVGGSFLNGDKFYLLKEKDNQTGRVDLKVNKVLESGAVVKLSYHTGKYFMYVEREGNANFLGEIKVEITGLTVPESAVAGEKISISGNGFNPDGKLFAKPASGTDVDLKSTYADGAVSATLPEDMAAGTYALYYQQEADCNYTLAEAFVISEPKPVVKGKKVKSLGLMGETLYSFTYTPEGELATVDGAPVTKDGNKYSFAGKGMDMDGYDVQGTYTYEVNDNKAMSVSFAGTYVDGGDAYSAEFACYYNNNGNMTDFAGMPLPWENGNYATEAVIYGDSPQHNHPLAPYDPAVILDALLAMSLPSDIIPVMLVGFGGIPSKDLPTDVVLDFDPETGEPIGQKIKYEFDGDGYMTKMDLGDLGLVLEFAYFE